MSTKQVSDQSDDELLKLAREGSSPALQAMFERYRRFVLLIVRRRLHQPLRRLTDSEDIVQDVQLELCAQTVPAAALASAPELVGYLCVLALRKLTETRRHFVEAQRRALGRDVPLERVPEPSQPETARPEDLAPRERLDRFERGLPRKLLEIVELLRAGQTHAAIAVQLQISERTVGRFVHKLRSLPPPPKVELNHTETAKAGC